MKKKKKNRVVTRLLQLAGPVYWTAFLCLAIVPGLKHSNVFYKAHVVMFVFWLFLGLAGFCLGLKEKEEVNSP